MKPETRTQIPKPDRYYHHVGQIFPNNRPLRMHPFVGQHILLIAFLAKQINRLIYYGFPTSVVLTREGLEYDTGLAENFVEESDH